MNLLLFAISVAAYYDYSTITVINNEDYVNKHLKLFLFSITIIPSYFTFYNNMRNGFFIALKNIMVSSISEINSNTFNNLISFRNMCYLNGKQEPKMLFCTESGKLEFYKDIKKDNDIFIKEKNDPPIRNINNNNDEFERFINTNVYIIKYKEDIFMRGVLHSLNTEEKIIYFLFSENIDKINTNIDLLNSYNIGKRPFFDIILSYMFVIPMSIPFIVMFIISNIVNIIQGFIYLLKYLFLYNFTISNGKIIGELKINITSTFMCSINMFLPFISYIYKKNYETKHNKKEPKKLYQKYIFDYYIVI